jgi:hypothetical protein
MRFRWIGLLVLLSLMVVTAFQNVLPASAQVSSENITSTSGNNTLDSSAQTQTLSIQGIWNVSLLGTGITMAVNQASDSISGKCKFEGAEPWNGVFAGLLSGNAVNIAVAALQGKVIVSTEITGTISDDVLQGSYVSYDSDGNEAKGDVTGTRISLDTTDYTPAEVKAAPAPVIAPATAPESTPVAVQQPQTVQLTQPNAATENQATKSRVKDVTELAKGIDPNIMPWSFPL